MKVGVWLMIVAQVVDAARRPVCAATWSFGAIAVEEARLVLDAGGSAMDAVERGVRAVELDTRDQYYVGVGGFPNADGEMELDAAMMDGQQRYGAVMALKRITTPISVARSILEHCPHNILCGEGAHRWAVDHGFLDDPGVLTPDAHTQWKQWKQDQPNRRRVDEHDTVGLICMDAAGDLCAGTSTSGWAFKHPGRVGDSPLIGSGLYCEAGVGAAVATGDGEEIMRACVAFAVVELMRAGTPVELACATAVRRVSLLPRPSLPGMHRQLTVAVLAMDAQGNIGAASTLSEGNPHRGRPLFPAPCWRAGAERAELAASLRGARF